MMENLALCEVFCCTTGVAPNSDKFFRSSARALILGRKPRTAKGIGIAAGNGGHIRDYEGVDKSTAAIEKRLFKFTKTPSKTIILKVKVNKRRIL